MDISELFKASVQTVSLRNKDLGIVSNNRNAKKTRIKSPFFVKARTVAVQIMKLRQFLLENRKAYMNFSNHLSYMPSMTDEDRDQIDLGAQKIMTTCAQLMKELVKELKSSNSDTSPQNLEHRQIMLHLIEDYLKNVCKIYSEQKAMRVKRAMEVRKIAKLELESPRKTAKILADNRDKADANADEQVEAKDGKVGSTESSPLKIQELNGDMNSLIYEEELSPEDIQLFEAENEQLYNELNTVTEEVRQIESKVVHIAELQEIFTEKVLDQDKDLDRLMNNVVGATENVREANEQIRQAIQRNAGLRVWILFFLLVMSFSLLFLDWYNP